MTHAIDAACRRALPVRQGVPRRSVSALAICPVVRVGQTDITRPPIPVRIASVPSGLDIVAIPATGFAFGMIFASAIGAERRCRVGLADQQGEAIPRPGAG